MTSPGYRPPCPEVVEGDADSFIARARWLISQTKVGDWRQRAEQDIERAEALNPAAWQPPAMRAELSDEVGPVLRYCGEAIGRGADSSVRLQRARLLAKFGRFAEAEEDYTAILEASAVDGMARSERVMVRAQRGNFAGAIADLSRTTNLVTAHGSRELLGIIRWIQGDFAAAYEAFALPVEHNGSESRHRIWRHICQVAHGVAMPMPAEGVGRLPDARLGGELWCGGSSYLPVSDQGPSQPVLDFWDLVCEMFLDRIEPSDVVRAARRSLEESDAWQLPSDMERAHIRDYTRSTPPVWRSQVQFYCGLWYLSKGQLGASRQALHDAAHGDQSFSLERLAAAAQLERLARREVGTSNVEPLALPSSSPFSAVVAKFAGLDLDMPGLLNPTPLGASLDLARQDLGDRGLRRLLESRNTRFVTRLNLAFNSVSTAGMAAFRESPNVVNLVELNLTGNHVGDTGLGTLLHSAALVSLKSLDLTDTGLTDAGAEMLVHQHQVGLQRVLLGKGPIDMPIWRRLAERYGEGFCGVGDFLNPYRPPFDDDRLVRFSYVPSRDAEPWDRRSPFGTAPANWPESSLVFKLVDYIAWQLKSRANAPDPQRGSRFIEQSLASMREIEERFANSSRSVHTENGRVGYVLMSEGLEPVSLDCATCRRSYDRPYIRGPRPGVFSPDGVFFCPAGHELYG